MTNTAKETWEQWKAPDAPDPPLLTRTELLAAVERLGLEADERDLRYWESIGVLPGPVRRHHHGATRALYPVWMVDLIFAVRYMQQRGYSLKQLPERMKTYARLHASVLGLFGGNPDVGPDHPFRAAPPVMYPFSRPHFTSERRARLWSALDWLIQRYRRQEGREIVRIDVVLIDDQGRQIPYRVGRPLPSPIPKSE